MELTGRGAGLRAALACALGAVLLGAPVGLLWRALSPRPEVLASARGLELTDTETKAFIAADGTLFLLCVAAGLPVGSLAWRLARLHDAAVVLGTVAGSGLAAWVAYRTGTLGQDRGGLVAAAQQGRLTGLTELPLQLRATTVLLGWPAAAALALAVLAQRSRVRGRRRGR